jgi:hypothetical protein
MSIRQLALTTVASVALAVVALAGCDLASRL